MPIFNGIGERELTFNLEGTTSLPGAEKRAPRAQGMGFGMVDQLCQLYGAGRIQLRPDSPAVR